MFIAERSRLDDIAEWRALAREVEPLFGQRMAEEPQWLRRLVVNIERGTAWCVRDPAHGFAGGMWLSPRDERLQIGWLAVARRARRHGVGRALVLRAIEVAEGRPVEVVTFGPGHPAGSESEAARCLYHRLGFQPHQHDPGSDGTPRELLVFRPGAQSDGWRP